MNVAQINTNTNTNSNIELNYNQTAMNNNNSTAVMQKNGIQIQTRPTTSVAERPGYSNDNSASNVIQEQPWNLNMMLERPSFVNSYAWTTTAASHAIIAKLKVPQDLLVNSITTAPFSLFQYWRGSVNVHAQVVATPLHQGLLAMVYVPLTQPVFIENNIITNFASLSINPCVYLYANANTSAELTIPFNSPLHYMNLQAPYDATDNISFLGHIYIVVFNPLQASASSTLSVNVSLFTRFTDNEFKVPAVSSPSSVFRAQSGFITSLAKKIIPKDIVKKGVSMFSSELGPFAPIVNSAIPDNIVGDALDFIHGVTGLDKPLDPNFNAPSKFVAVSPMNYSVGVEHIDKMVVDPSNVALTAVETFASTCDEMNFDELKMRYSYLGSFNLSTSQIAGTILASLPINPIPNYILLGTNNVMPLISYLTLPFNFWKGGLTYKIQAVSTSFQTAKIFFAVNYGQYLASSSLNIYSLTSQYGSAFEINQGTNEFEFTVPYVATTSQLYVTNNNVPSINDSMGTINIAVINPLVAPNNTPITITFNVFMAGAHDFEVSTLSFSNNVYPAPNASMPLVRSSKPKIFKAQSANAQPLNIAPTTTFSTSSDENVLAPNDNTQNRSDVSERSLFSIRNLLRKYQLMYRSYSNNTTGANYEIFNISTLLSKVPNNLESFGIMSHYAALFRSYKGSLRFKIILEDCPDVFTYSVNYIPPVLGYPVLPSDTPTANNIQSQFRYDTTGIPATTVIDNSTRLTVSYVNSIQKCAEFEVPFESIFKSVLINTWQETVTVGKFYSDLGSIVINFYPIFQADPPNAINYSLYMSFSDESRFGNLYNIPYLMPNAIQTGEDLSPLTPDSFITPTNPNFTLTIL
jgi:hypothetical protein